MESMELKDYGRILKKRWPLITATVLLVCTLAVVYNFMYVQPVYVASTKLIVNKSNVNVGGIDQPSISEINANIMLINTYKEIIRSTAIMDQVASQHPEFGLTAEQLIRRVNVSSVNDTQVMILSVTDSEYEAAMNIVNAVAKVFQQSIPTIMQVDNVTILDEAKPKHNPTPIGVNPMFNIVVSFMVALMLSVVLSFLLEYLDDKLRSERDVTHMLALPTIAAIHTISKKDLHAGSAKSIAGQVKEVPYATLNQ